MKKKVVPLYGFQKEAEEYFGWSTHPKQWFEFLSWLTAFSALQYLNEKVDSIYIKIIYFISYIVLFNFIQKKMWAKKLQDYLPSKISGKTRVIVTYMISAICVGMVYFFVARVVDILVVGLQH